MSNGTAILVAEDDPCDILLFKRAFSQTGYRIDRAVFWDYFLRRGSAITFGYPVSRDFLFEGCTTQFFQRMV